LGKIEQPAGTVTVSWILPEIHWLTCRMLSQYSRAEEAPVAGSQYSIRLSSRREAKPTAI
jgi:hypothetical protein